MSLVDNVLEVGYNLLDRGLVPDFVLRRVIRALLRQRLREIEHGSLEANHAAKMEWIAGVKARSSIADVPEKANEQHYEVSTDFILSTLGPYAKYSSCLYPTGKETLEEAEILMLNSYCEKAQLADGQDVLDLGCDVNTHEFEESKRFDRILSIEMFEHMKNYQMLLRKVSTWLRSNDSLLFIHIFCHKTTPYHFEEGDGWMAKNFFSGGTMPSLDLFAYFQEDLTLIKSWYLSGVNYSRTLEDWLKIQDSNQKAGLKELRNDATKKGLDPVEAEKTFYRFRVFYMACSELFNMNGGQEWGVGHYLFRRKH
ncbi:hypothetical protein AAF712_014269 [Marasmius tenuissimus]|uniref:Uncharacterized protein n=1 Tax=Marasmius tenuissimus TaxID=585030 RepID=A0ABR2ZBK4_9AGAR